MSLKASGFLVVVVGNYLTLLRNFQARTLMLDTFHRGEHQAYARNAHDQGTVCEIDRPRFVRELVNQANSCQLLHIVIICLTGTMNAINTAAALAEVRCLFYLPSAASFYKKNNHVIVSNPCLIIALIAAIHGFGGIAGSFVGVAKIRFIVFLVLTVLSVIGGAFRRGNRAV